MYSIYRFYKCYSSLCFNFLLSLLIGFNTEDFVLYINTIYHCHCKATECFRGTAVIPFEPVRLFRDELTFFLCPNFEACNQ